MGEPTRLALSDVYLFMVYLFVVCSVTRESSAERSSGPAAVRVGRPPCGWGGRRAGGAVAVRVASGGSLVRLD